MQRLYCLIKMDDDTTSVTDVSLTLHREDVFDEGTQSILDICVEDDFVLLLHCVKRGILG
jgi:hypothetical protein